MFGKILHDAGLLSYRAAARVVAAALARSDLVRSVCVHRSVATGEITFGRSDIDLLVIIREPSAEGADGDQLAELCRAVRWLCRLNPALGHVEVHDARGLRDWIGTDTYRGSVERRSMRRIWGDEVEIPWRPIRVSRAIPHLAVWPYNHFSMAVRQRNVRNLRKSALEMWNAYAVAMGMIREPFLTRRETEAFHDHRVAGRGLAGAGKDLFLLRQFALQTAADLHRQVRSALAQLPEPFIFQCLLPPRFHQRTFVVLPGASSDLPPAAFAPDSFVCTPELLHLYVEFVNPFLHAMLPEQIRSLGFQPPCVEAFVHSSRCYIHSYTLRNPGFQYPQTWPPVGGVAVVGNAIEYLRNGEVPPPTPPKQIAAVLATPPSVSDYYRSIYPRLLREQESLWDQLRDLPGGEE